MQISPPPPFFCFVQLSCHMLILFETTMPSLFSIQYCLIFEILMHCCFFSQEESEDNDYSPSGEDESDVDIESDEGVYIT